MISWALVSLLVVASAENVEVEGPPGIRTHCHQGSSLVFKGEQDAIKEVFFPRLRGRYPVGSFDGQGMQGRIQGDESELLLSEEGRFRRVMQTQGRILAARPSADARYLAVAVSRELDPDRLRPALSTLYLVDTETWEPEVMVRSLGYAGMSWSPQGDRLAVADFSNLRVYDTRTGTVQEHCLFDSVAVPDGNEWLRYVRWTGDNELTLDYQHPTRRYRYQVNLP